MLNLKSLQEQFLKSGGNITPVQLGVVASNRTIYVEDNEYIDLSDINLKPDFNGFYQWRKLLHVLEEKLHLSLIYTGMRSLNYYVITLLLS